MKKLLLVVLLLSCSFLYAQSSTNTAFKLNKQRWSLSANAGYINVSNTPGARYQSNGWTSLCINYSIQKWSFGTWTGANYWIDGKQADLRSGFTVTYTIKKW